MQKNLRIVLTMHYLVQSFMQFPEFIGIHIHFSRILTWAMELQVHWI